MTTRTVDEQGVCSSCNQDANTTSLPCLKCKAVIHTVNCTSGDDLCTQTLVNMWPNIANKYKNIQFLCPGCLESVSETSAKIKPEVADKMSAMEEKLLALSADFSKLKESLLENNPTQAGEPKAVVVDAQAGEPKAVVVDADIHTTKPPSQNTYVTEDAVEHQEVDKVTPYKHLHNKDKSRTNVFGKVLSSVGRLPRSIETVVIGDSNYREIDGQTLDPNGTVAVKYSSGLCIPATVHGLKYCKRTHRNISHVVYCIGYNDAMHEEEQHHANQRVEYVKLLHAESKRVFPRAKITFLLPPTGLYKVDAAYIDSLSKDIKQAAVQIKQVRTSSVKGMLARDNIHVNGKGKSILVDSIKRVLPSKPREFSNMSGRRSNVNTNNYRVDNCHFPYLHSEPSPSHNTQGMSTQGMSGYINHANDRGYRSALDYRSSSDHQTSQLPIPSAPPQNSVQPKMAKEILQFVANLMGQN